MPKKTRYLIGGGGHAQVLLDAIISSNQNVNGIIDPEIEIGTEIFGITVVGNDSFLNSLEPSTDELVNGLGSTGNLISHKNLFNDLSNRGFTFCGVIHPSVIIGRDCEIDRTSQIMAGVIIQNRVTIGKNVILNTRSSIDHDVSIGDNSIISPGVIICGKVKIGANVFIGAGTVIIQGINIGNDCIIGAGTLVRHDIKGAMFSIGKIQRESQCEKISEDYDNLIKEHYDTIGNSNLNSGASTMSDQMVRHKETEFIKDQITEHSLNFKNSDSSKESKFSIIDVGCGSGYTLTMLSETFPNYELTGLEYNNAMRASAKKNLRLTSVQLLAGDVRNYSTMPETEYDFVVCQRVLINLLNIKDQKTALENILKLLKPNGKLIFIESFKSGLAELNQAREEFGLEKILPAYHNLYLDDEFLNHPQLNKLKNKSENALSTHYFVSRVLHPVLLRALGAEESRNSKFVSFMSSAVTNSIGEFSPLRFFVFEKIQLE